MYLGGMYHHRPGWNTLIARYRRPDTSRHRFGDDSNIKADKAELGGAAGQHQCTRIQWGIHVLSGSKPTYFSG